jgi:hypothetical protein
MTTENKTTQTTEPAIAVEPMLAAGWISTTERMPKTADKYLVCYKYGSGRQEIHIEVWDEKRGCFDCFLEDIITHWMPMIAFPACR